MVQCSGSLRRSLPYGDWNPASQPGALPQSCTGRCGALCVEAPARRLQGGIRQLVFTERYLHAKCSVSDECSSVRLAIIAFLSGKYCYCVCSTSEGKPRQREAKGLARGHPDRIWQSWDPNKAAWSVHSTCPVHSDTVLPYQTCNFACLVFSVYSVCNLETRCHVSLNKVS